MKTIGKRILVIGICGAGKSTLAKELSARTGLPLIHLDQHHWSPGWVESDKALWREKVAELCTGESWVMDGNFGGTLDLRLKFADSVVWLDYSTPRALWRALKRVVRYYGRSRPDMTEGCPERLDLEFLHYILTFKATKNKKIESQLTEFSNSKPVFRFKHPSEAKGFLRRVRG
ncbi:MAG: hypothetical protein R2684_17565 [Pyrinomonadaceae bacterium]